MNKTMVRFLFGIGLVLLVLLLLSSCTVANISGKAAASLSEDERPGVEEAPVQDGAESLDTAELEAATIAALEEIGWDVEGFRAEVGQVDGEYARLTIHSTNPPGGFTAYLKQENGIWSLLTQGSAFNPEELHQLGIPASLIP